jgi:cytosine/adenosine deaminase-related metal-dependent hydrolase
MLLCGECYEKVWRTNYPSFKVLNEHNRKNAPWLWNKLAHRRDHTPREWKSGTRNTVSRMLSSGMWRLVGLVRTYVPEEGMASIFRVQKIRERKRASIVVNRQLT